MDRVLYQWAAAVQRRHRASGLFKQQTVFISGCKDPLCYFLALVFFNVLFNGVKFHEFENPSKNEGLFCYSRTYNRHFICLSMINLHTLKDTNSINFCLLIP